MALQIFHGTVVLTLCAAIHLAVIVLSLPLMTQIAQRLKKEFDVYRAGLLIALAFAVVVLGHTLQVWVWAISFLILDAMQSLEAAVYFSLTSYTTVGYGDIVLAEDMRIFGAFSSVSGMLMFGVSTAFLVGVIARVLPIGLK